MGFRVPAGTNPVKASENKLRGKCVHVERLVCVDFLCCSGLGATQVGGVHCAWCWVQTITAEQLSATAAAGVEAMGWWPVAGAGHAAGCPCL